VKLLQDERAQGARVGVVTGLAWTSTGGEVLFVEALKMPGKGGLMLTGQLGDVMKESAQAALSYIRSRGDAFEIEPRCSRNSTCTSTSPKGRSPRNGPSAGLAMATVLLSVLKGVPVKNTFAMTGEIDLRGEALAIGGLKEKALAALRVGSRTSSSPSPTRRTWRRSPPRCGASCIFHPVKQVEEVFEIALEGWIRPEKRKKTQGRQDR